MPGQRKHGLGATGGDWRGSYYGAQKNDAASDTARALRITRAIDNKKINEGKKEKPPLRPIAIRPMQIEDASYVLDSWANSYRRSQTVGPIDREVFNIEQRARIDRLVCRAASRVFVACDAEQTTQIRGWICFEAPFGANKVPIVHYVCVHPAYQMSGIGTALVSLARQTHTEPDAPMWCTHETQPMRHVRPKWVLLYNPYLLEVSDKTAATRDVNKAEGVTVYGI